MCFIDLAVNGDGRWEVSVSTLNAYVQTTTDVESCPVVQGMPYDGVEQTSVRPAVPQHPCKFGEHRVPHTQMLEHIAERISKEDTLAAAEWVGDAVMICVLLVVPLWRTARLYPAVRTSHR